MGHWVTRCRMALRQGHHRALPAPATCSIAAHPAPGLRGAATDRSPRPDTPGSPPRSHRSCALPGKTPAAETDERRPRAQPRRGARHSAAAAQDAFEPHHGAQRTPCDADIAALPSCRGAAGTIAAVPVDRAPDHTFAADVGGDQGPQGLRYRSALLGQLRGPADGEHTYRTWLRCNGRYGKSVQRAPSADDFTLAAMKRTPSAPSVTVGNTTSGAT